MANIAWEGDDSADWNTGSNWVGGTKPGSSDVAVFDGAVSSNNCLLDSDESILGISVETDYEGTIDLGDTAQTLSLGTSGGVIAGHANSTFDFGDATIAITGGPWITVNHAGTWTRSTGTVTFAGTCTINTGTTNDFHNLMVMSGTATVSTNSTQSQGIITLNGTLSINAAKIMYCSNVATLILNDGGRVTGSGSFFIYPGSGEGVTTFHSGGTFDVANFRIINPNVDGILSSGNYQSIVLVLNNGVDAKTLAFDAAGAYTFTSLELETTSTGSITLANNTNGPASITIAGDLTIDEDAGGTITINDSGKSVDWDIRGDVIDQRTGDTFTWTKGTGDITLSGSADQDIAFMGQVIEDIIINKSAGALSISGGFTTDSFTGTSTGTGDFDPGEETITVIGNCSWAAAFDFNSGATTMNGCTWVIGGNFTADGQTLAATASWVLTVTGTAVASGTGSVQYSNAEAGTEITALEWTDGNNNINWSFVSAINSISIGGGFDEYDMPIVVRTDEKIRILI